MQPTVYQQWAAAATSGLSCNQAIQPVTRAGYARVGWCRAACVCDANPMPNARSVHATSPSRHATCDHVLARHAAGLQAVLNESMTHRLRGVGRTCRYDDAARGCARLAPRAGELWVCCADCDKAVGLGVCAERGRASATDQRRRLVHRPQSAAIRQHLSSHVLTMWPRGRGGLVNLSQGLTNSH
jgi:hypothetical protein